MQKSPSLLEIQTWLRWAITDPRGVERALAGEKVEELNPERYIEPQPRLLRSIVESSVASQEERLSVYAEAYFSRLLEAMENDFPRVAEALKEDFPIVCAAYLEIHPSTSPNIENIGGKFPQFLKTYSFTSAMPYVHDLARLEWAKIESFYALDSERVSPESLRGISDVAWSGAKFDLCSSLRILSLDYSVNTLLASETEKVKKEKTFILIQRQNDWPVVTRLEKNEYLVLSFIQEGECLGSIFSKIRGSEPAEVTGWFSTWIQSGLISAVRLESS